MAEAFYRLKSAGGDWTRVTGTAPITVTGLTEGAVYEYLKGDGTIGEVTAGEPIITPLNPQTYFVNNPGTLGYYLDMTDATTVYQDTARTTLVQEGSNRVGGVADLSGNGNHFEQATAELQLFWIVENEISRVRSTGSGNERLTLVGDNLDLGGATKATMIIGMKQTNNTDAGIVAETGAPFSGDGGISVTINNTVNNRVGAGVGDGTGFEFANADALVAAPVDYIVRVTADVTQAAGSELSIFVDGVEMPQVSVVSSGDATAIGDGAGSVLFARQDTSAKLHDIYAIALIAGDVLSDDAIAMEAHIRSIME